MEKLINYWKSTVSNSVQTFSALETISSRIPIITTENCGVLVKIENFAEKLVCRHIESCELLIKELFDDNSKLRNILRLMSEHIESEISSLKLKAKAEPDAWVKIKVKSEIISKYTDKYLEASEILNRITYDDPTLMQQLLKQFSNLAQIDET